MNVADRMRVRPATIAPEASLAEAQRVMTCARTAALVVSRYDRVVGVITEVDLALARPSPATTLAIREIRWWSVPRRRTSMPSGCSGTAPRACCPSWTVVTSWAS
jgi:CBS-domain-containing membrane protein